MWQFSETIAGMSEACKAFGTPVTGGNVSFYNETDGRGINPTPVIGMVGIVEDLPHVTTQWFKRDDCAIILLGATEDDLGATEYSLVRGGGLDASPPRLDLELEGRVQEACLKIIQAGLVESAHDCSDGGLGVALAECTFSSYRHDVVGCEVNLEGKLSQASLMFSETPSRILLSGSDDNVDQILKLAHELDVSATVIGRTGGERLRLRVNGETVVDRAVSQIEEAWRNSLAVAVSG
jgi:phosphoribosylformylglycinamidine synthase